MPAELEKSIVDRRSTLISLIGAAIAFAAPRAEAEAKVSQDAVHYQTLPRDGQECSQCAQYVAPHVCRMVDGYIAPTGWCGLWVQKPSEGDSKRNLPVRLSFHGGHLSAE